MRKSPRRHKVKAHTRSDGDVVHSYSRGSGSHREMTFRRKVHIPDGTVTLYHGTDKSHLESILKEGELKLSTKGHTKGTVFTTTNFDEAKEYAEQGGEARGYRVKVHDPVVLVLEVPVAWLRSQWKLSKVWHPSLHPKYWDWSKGDLESFPKLGVVQISTNIPSQYIKKVIRT